MKRKTMKIIALLVLVLMLASCGNSWELTKKNLASDYTELERSVTVYDSLTEAVLWTFSGVCYISDSGPGDISIIFYDEAGKTKKADFIGRTISVTAIEL